MPEQTTRLSEAKKALMETLVANRLPASGRGAIPRRKERSWAPLSTTQSGVWLMEQFHRGTSVFHVCDGRRLTGPIDLPDLDRAATGVIRRHDALRTTFGRGANGEPEQRIGAAYDCRIPLIDLSALPASELEPELKRLAEAEAKAPFDLERGPLLRIRLYRLAPEEHALVLVFHHLIADGWSHGLFLQELTALYNEPDHELPELPIQYGDFAEWEARRLMEKPLQDKLTYWKQQLSGRLPVLELPTDFQRPPVQSYRGGVIHAIAPAALAEQITALCRIQSISPFMFWLAAWGALLRRHSGQPVIMIGTPTANRSRVELEGLIGFFSNTVVIRCDFEGDLAFREVLGRVRAVTLDALSNQELPYETLLKSLNPERTMSYNPLFQAGFSLLPPEPQEELAGTMSRGLRVSNSASRCDIWLSVFEERGETALALEYASDLFTEATAQRLVGHLLILVTAAVGDPGLHLSELPLLTAAEQQKLLVDWNRTQQTWPVIPVIHRLIEARAAERPDQTAVVCGEVRLTYGELNRRANRLARQLRALGAGPEHLVGICMDRTVDLVVGLLAILKAGSGYLPLDPAHPERLRFMLEDADIRLLVVHRHLLDVLSVPDRCRVLCFEQKRAFFSDEDLEGGAGPTNVAYVMYTSGSTGQPKGVVIEHRNLVNLLLSMQRQPGLEPDDILAAVTSISFDITGLELYLPLVTGATLVIVPAEIARDGRLLARLLAETHATVMQATPVTWRLLKEAGWKPDRRLKMLIGGEALPRDLACWLPADGAELWNMYGPTETTIWSTIWRVEPRAATLSIGRPIANTQIYVLDRRQNPVPVGVRGELYIGGDGLARGYLNQPDSTADGFVTSLRGRVYRTGDLVRYLPDGNLEFLGRIDQQVKVRGHRVEPGEVEAALERHPAVGRVAVSARPDGSGENRLIAYIVPVPGAIVPSFVEMQAFLKKTLSNYMIPSLFVPMDALPLTPSGKVDRKGLPAPEAVLVQRDTVHMEPRTPAEAILASIWADVLNLERVSAAANFFELGGHSLLGLRMLIKVQAAFGVDLPLRVLLDTPAVDRLAATIMQRGGKLPDDEVVADLLVDLEGKPGDDSHE